MIQNYKAASSINAQVKSIWISLDPASPGKCNTFAASLQSPRCLPVTRWRTFGNVAVFLCPFPGSVHSVVEHRLHNGRTDPAHVSDKGFSFPSFPSCFFPFSPPLLNFVWLFIVLFFRRTLLISLDFSNLHLEFAFMFCFPSSYPCILQGTPNSLETRDQNAWSHIDTKFKLHYKKYLKHNTISE